MFMAALGVFLNGLVLVLLGYAGLYFSAAMDANSLLFVLTAIGCFILALIGIFLMLFGLVGFVVSGVFHLLG